MSDNKDFNNNSEYSTVTLSLDDGTELECAIIRTFPAGDKNYIALLPIADIDKETKKSGSTLLKRNILPEYL